MNHQRVDVLTQLLGAAAALCGTAVLVVFASMQGDAMKIVSFSIYGMSLFSLYLVSTLHYMLKNGVKLFQKLDHIAIYLLIAGTYTPVTLVSLRGLWGWSIFGTVWGLAILGIVIDTVRRRGSRIVPIIIYVTMGWSCMVAVSPLVDSLSLYGFAWLLAGGLFYSMGIAFYLLGQRRPVYHLVWHLFVLAGSISHYVTIFFYVL